MITLTGTDTGGQPQTRDLEYILDPGVEYAIARGLTLRGPDLIGQYGPVQVYSARPNDEQLHAASILATRVLRRRLATTGPFFLGRVHWGSVTEVLVDAQTMREVQQELQLRTEAEAESMQAALDEENSRQESNG